MKGTTDGGAGRSTGRVSLPAIRPSLPGAAMLLGATAPTAPARALISLHDRNAAQLQSFIAKVSDPSSPSYEHYMTPAQFDATYAPSASTVPAGESFAHHSGLEVQAVPSNRADVYVTGLVAQMQRAFATSTKVVSGNEAQIVSNSSGGASDATDTTSDGYWEQAAAKGIGVYFSSGDSGDRAAPETPAR